MLKRILTTFYGRSDDEKEKTEGKCWVSKREKVGNRIHRNRIGDVKVFTKRWNVKIRRQSQEMAN